MELVNLGPRNWRRPELASGQSVKQILAEAKRRVGFAKLLNWDAVLGEGCRLPWNIPLMRRGLNLSVKVHFIKQVQSATQFESGLKSSIRMPGSPNKDNHSQYPTRDPLSYSAIYPLQASTNTSPFPSSLQIGLSSSCPTSSLSILASAKVFLVFL